MSTRPVRIRITNELGLVQTPASGKGQFERLGFGDALLLIGIGPEPSIVFDELQPGRAVYAIEAPQFKGQMPPEWNKAIPENVKWLEPSDLTSDLLDSCEVWIYLPGARLFPSYYGRPAAFARWYKTIPAPVPAAKSVIMPAAEDALLVKEMDAAFKSAGYTVYQIHPKLMGQELPRLLALQQPALFFSINFKGLDPHGEAFHLLEAAGVPTCVWCVDNPFHLISGLRSPYWKELTLAITDDSFTPALKKLGAQKVHHMPLAASPGIFEPKGQSYGLEGRLSFVGRLEFPSKAKFFSGIKLPDWQWQSAQMLLDQGGTPDFNWWVERLEIDPLWPGHDVRKAGLGAEEASRHRRLETLLTASANLPVTIFGDDAWQDQLPQGADIRGPVDYYSALPDIYREAAWTLNITSLLLPAGCTQRHFDVWATGGFLLSDATPGLSIFPQELAQEISFRHPRELAPLAKRLAPGTALRDDLQQAWKQEILSRHTYQNRVQELFGII